MERKFDIVTDSACDMPQEYYGERGIDCIPLGFTLDGVTYEGEDGEQIGSKEFFKRMREGGMPKTFQITPAQARLHLERHVKAGRDVLAVPFSSGLSGTCESYMAAARELNEEYPSQRIAVVDSLCASMGQGLFVEYIARMADSGASLDETVAYAEELRPHICHYFTVDDLFHLKRGGRVSAATAVVGSMLNIKPVLHVDGEGHLIPVGKAMGRKKSVTALADRMSELATLGEDDPVYITHGDCIGDAEFLASLVRARFGEREIRINYIGSVIGTHTGAGVVTLFFRGKHR